MKTICYVMCPGHSGSTLLGNVLGSHPSCIHVGELVAPIAKGKAVVCRYCGASECPVWGRLILEREAKELYAAFQRWRSTQSRSLRTVLLGDHNTIYRKLFAANPAVGTIIDSSKDISWTRFNRSRKYRFVYVFLRRDLRAYFNSMNRSYGTLREDGLIEGLRATVAGLRNLYSQIEPTDRYVVDYESLVGTPKPSLEALCEWLNLTFDDRMLEFYKHPQHLIGGNPSLVAQAETGESSKELDAVLADAPSSRSRERLISMSQTRGFDLDESWRTELTPDELAYVEDSLASARIATERVGDRIYYAL